MALLRDTPIRRKLTIIGLLTSAAALVLACAAFVAYEQIAFRHTMTRDLSILARVVGANCAGALSFDDRSTADKTLAGLAAQPHIVAACLYDKDGVAFATYRRDGAAAVQCPPPGEPSERFSSHALELFQRIDFAGETIGTIYIQSDLQEMRDRLRRYAGIAIAVLLIATLAAYVTASRLQRLVSRPISELADVAERVRRAKDYSARVVKRGDDELGALVDVFNAMLEQIQSRETDLAQRVAERTRELHAEIAERTAAESRLAGSLSILHATLEATADGILVVNHRNQTMSSNRKFAEMWHVPAGLLASGEDARLLEFAMMQLQEPEAFTRRVNEIYSDPEAESFDTLHFRDGRIFERYSQPQHIAGTTVGRVWCFRDVTARQRAEERLRVVSAALEAAPNTIVITDATGTIQWVNPSFTRETGYSFTEAVGQNPRVLKSGRHPPEYYAELWRTVLSGRSWHGEFINRRKNGEIFIEDATIAPVHDANGTIRHLVAIKLNITARKALETQLRQAQKMETVGQLAGGIAHDFNNILTAMMLNLELLRAEPALPRGAKPPLQDLHAMMRRAARLTEQLLLFARKHVMRTERLDLNAVLANVLKMLSRLLGEHVTVNFLRRPLPLWIEADAGMLDQVVMNLCVNARDAMPDGGQLTIELTAVQFDAESAKLNAEARPGEFACLRVSDTGHGMSPDVLAHTFEPFFTTKEVGKGTGLGLATVHGIVHQHSGWISVESALERGTTFRLYFPLAAPTAHHSGGDDDAKATIPRGSETILLVEDEEIVRRITAEMLGRLGYRVLVAVDGPDAIRLWQQHASTIQLLLSDMVMPHGRTGLDLAEIFRREKPRLKVVIITGYSSEFTKHERLAAKGIELLGKPFELGELAATLRRSLGEK